MEIREILSTKCMNQESANQCSPRQRVKEKVARARKERRAIPMDRSRSSSPAIAVYAREQVTTNKSEINGKMSRDTRDPNATNSGQRKQANLHFHQQIQKVT